MDTLKDFEQWLLEDGKSPKTVESYCNDVKQFQKYVQQVNEDALLTRYLFVRYKQYLIDEEVEQVLAYLVHIYHFFIIKKEPLTDLNTSKRTRMVLYEIESIFQYILLLVLFHDSQSLSKNHTVHQ